MATYNGEKYIREQIDSILGQNVQDFILYINDDVSTDNTFSIISQYAEKFPEKIFVSQSAKNSGNAKHNFLKMMATHKNDYVMLCDQDDVWLLNKIEVTLEKMKETEKNYPNTPILVHTDLSVVDENLELVHLSYKQATIRNYSRTELRQTLNINNVTGCTIMYNRQLANLFEQPPKFCEIHDWWVQIVASAFGKIAQVDKPTLMYRQHRGNSIGAKDVRTFSYKLKTLFNNAHIKRRIASTYPQAESLMELYGDILSDSQKKLLHAFISIPSKNKLARVFTVFKHRFFMNNLSRNIAYFLFI
jgi:glycosyltransferase involved in cell wall biosynthesis